MSTVNYARASGAAIGGSHYDTLREPTQAEYIAGLLQAEAHDRRRSQKRFPTIRKFSWDKEEAKS